MTRICNAHVRILFCTLLTLSLFAEALPARVVSAEALQANRNVIQIGAFRSASNVKKLMRTFRGYDLYIFDEKGLHKVYLVNIPPRKLSEALAFARESVPGAFVTHLKKRAAAPLGAPPAPAAHIAKKTAAEASYFIQAGLFSSKAHALQAAESLSPLPVKVERSGKLYAVTISGFASLSEAKKRLREVKTRYPDAFIALGVASPLKPPREAPARTLPSTVKEEVAPPVFEAEKPAAEASAPPGSAVSMPHRRKPILKKEAVPLDSRTILQTRKKFY